MGYGDALRLAEKKIDGLSPDAVVNACGARYENNSYFISWFNSMRNVSEASDSNKILWLHYLAAGGAKTMSGRLIAYREAAPALFYDPNFYKRAVAPFVEHFGKDPQSLIVLGESLGGVKNDVGDASVTINVLPYLPLTFVIWKGDDEFPPDGNILFDKTATSWFSPEDLAVLASSAVYEMIKINKNKYKTEE